MWLNRGRNDIFEFGAIVDECKRRCSVYFENFKSVFGWGNVLRECNVTSKFKYFKVNFIVWIIIWRIFKMIEIYELFCSS